MKISTFLTCAAVALSSAVLQAAEIPADITNLYIIGDAAPEGWNLGSAPEFTAKGNGVFTWTGHLGTGQFKFALSRDNWSSLVSADSDNYGVELDTPMAVSYCPEGADNDWKWYNNEAGEYVLTVNVKEATLVVSETQEVIVTNLFLIGDASPAGWDLGKAPAFGKTAEEGVLTLTGRVGLGQFKFATTRDSFNSMVAESDNFGVELDTPMAMEYCADGDENDNKWYNNEAGAYTLTADLNANTLTVAAYDAADITALYLIGNASDAEWTIENAIAFTAEGDGVFTLTGANLKAGDFKFLVSNEGWDSVVAGAPNTEIVNDAELYLLVNNDGQPNDNKFVVTEETAGTYDIAVNLKAATVQLTLGESRLATVEAENDAAAVYYNLQGVRVANPEGGVFVKVANGNAVKVIK